MRRLTLLIATIFFLNAGLLYSAVDKFVKSGSEKSKTTEKSVSADNSYLGGAIDKIENPARIEGPGMLSTTINLFVSLLFVIGLIYLVMLAIKYFYVRSSIPMKNQGVIKVLAKEHLDSKKMIYVIEFADRIILAGAGTENINVLSEVTDPETVAKVREQADEYITKYRLKSESKFSEELKSSYVKQGKKMVKTGNMTVKKVMEKLKKSDDK